MARDWHAWHAAYDDPASSLSRRLTVVRDLVSGVLEGRSDRTRVISMCAGDGRDVLPVLVDLDLRVDALLVELDPDLAATARSSARDLGLEGVVVRTADAGTTTSYADHVPADVVLTCGVFGNVTDQDMTRTVTALPTLLAEGGAVVWTRGRRVPLDPTRVPGDPSDLVRRTFEAAGFEETAFVRPDDAGFRVGVHRLSGPAHAFRPGVPMFDFV